MADLAIILPVKHLLCKVSTFAGLDDKALEIFLERAVGRAIPAGGAILREAATVKALWIPAGNNHGEFGRGPFLEIRDPWDAQEESLALLEDGGGQ